MEDLLIFFNLLKTRMQSLEWRLNEFPHGDLVVAILLANNTAFGFNYTV